ncbi:EAL domain-containing protein [Oscillospiraceae bacterium MB08-C2-2]|nr:EAL domain-containing protein [Oscillospiraceae bacterium MB08-C2-2]
MDRQDQEIKLTNLLNLEDIQDLQDLFAAVSGMTVSVVNAQGQLITQPSNLLDFSHEASTTLEVYQTLLSSYHFLYDSCRNSQTAQTYFCRLTGLSTAVVPIFLETDFLGVWVVDLIKISDLSQQNIEASEEDSLPFNPQHFEIKDIENLPSVSHERLSLLTSLLEHITRTLVSMAERNQSVSQSNQELVAMTMQLNTTAEMLTKLIDSADVNLYVTDFFTGELLLANNRHAQLLGTTPGEMIGQVCEDIMGEDSTAFCGSCAKERLLTENGLPAEPYVSTVYNKEHNLWLRCTNQAINWVDGRLAHMVTYIDITENVALQEELSQLAFFDRHLKLPNSLKLIHDLNNLPADEDFSLICFDIQSLRKINDGYNRETGDNLLIQIRNWIIELDIPGATMYRIDGDEFGLALSNMDPSAVELLAQQLNLRFEDPWVLTTAKEKFHIFCNIFVGVIHNVKHFSDDNKLINLIERVMESARAEGRIVVYSESSDQKFQERLLLEMSLKNCINEGMKGFSVYYQPIVDPNTGMWCSLEALCRWESPEFGPVSPLVFIHEAEQMGLISVLGHWVLETAVRQCKQWGLDEHSRFILDVNLSPVQLADEGLFSKILYILRKYDYPGEKLSLEITESTQMNFTTHAITAIDRLRQHNIQVALDDFGTGYSSFNNLKNLPVSLLKTERAFIVDIENDTYLQYLLYVMVELAHAADMRLIAEGVENKEQLEILLKNGVDFVQGYLFSKPLPAAELEAKLHKFYQISNSTQSLNPNPVNLQRIINGESPLTLTPNLYLTLNQCMQLLMNSCDVYQSMTTVLSIIVDSLKLSRGYVYFSDTPLLFTQKSIWCDSMTRCPEMLAKLLDFREESPYWMDVLKTDKMILVPDRAYLPNEIQETLIEPTSQSFLVIGLFHEDEVIGFVGFDDCLHSRGWLPEEVSMLYNLCLIISNVTQCQQLEAKLFARETVLENVLHHPNIGICVTDPESGCILFANDKIRQAFGNPDIAEGRLFHEIRNPEDLSHLINSTSGESWEFENKQDGRFYRVSSSTISWNENQTVFLEQVQDITEHYERPAQLEAYRSDCQLEDQLYKPIALVEQLQKRLKEARSQNRPLSLCLIDINSAANGAHTPIQKKLLITSTLQTIKSFTRRFDMVAQLSEEQFVLVLSSCTKETALAKILNAKQTLLQSHIEGFGSSVFSFGIAEASEVPFTDEENHCLELLELVKSRIREFQKMH